MILGKMASEGFTFEVNNGCLEDLDIDTSEIEEDTSYTSCYEGYYVIETSSKKNSESREEQCYHHIKEIF